MREYRICREGSYMEYTEYAIDPEYALSHYLENTDEQGGFAYGYPKEDIYCVEDVLTGEVTRYVVDTETQPVFVCDRI